MDNIHAESIDMLIKRATVHLEHANESFTQYCLGPDERRRELIERCRSRLAAARVTLETVEREITVGLEH